MDWGAVLGAVGALVGVLSLLFTVYSWRTERRERQTADRVEREARLAEIAIERERLDIERGDRERQRHADITTVQLPHKKTREGERIYRFKVRNMGPGYSKHVRAWLQTAEGGQRLGGLRFGVPLDPGQEESFDVPVTQELWETREPLEVIVEWRNDRGQRQVERSNLNFDYDR